MEERVVPAAHLLGAALPPRLAWERAGRRAAWQALAGALLAALAVVGWQRLAASATTAAPPVVAGTERRAVRSSAEVAGTVRVPAAIALTTAPRQPASSLPLGREGGTAGPYLPARLAQPTAWKHTAHGTGEASYYARGFEGRPTASGEPYRAAKLTAAHRTLPFGTLLEVTNVRNGRSVIVRVNDRGPFHGRRVIDLSRAAAAEIGLLRRGRGPVRLDVLTR
jgi:rare lipoprotein A